MRPNDPPNVTLVSKRRGCLGLARSRHRSSNGDCGVEVRMICCFGSTLDNPHHLALWTVASTERLARPLRLTRMSTTPMPERVANPAMPFEILC
jgi:hypothetical protein